VWWNVYIALYSKFPAESVGERVFKIGYDLTKLLQKDWWLPFFWNTVIENLITTTPRRSTITTTRTTLIALGDPFPVPKSPGRFC